MKGLIFSVKKYAIHDGPGIRVTFFMKGCPLSCWWCHNPEGISPEPENVIRTDRVGDKEFSRTEVAGRLYSVDEVLDILQQERIFIDQSNGGVTFSGGEPLMQLSFIHEALQACKSNGYHTAVDTSGYYTSKKLEKVIPCTDLFLFDLKHIDPESHKKVTGVPNSIILKNFKLITRSKCDIMIRIPVIPGFNDADDHIARLNEFILENKTENIKMINLLPYHRTGSSKYKRFNRPYKMTDVLQPTEERMEELKALFSGTGIRVKIGG